MIEHPEAVPKAPRRHGRTHGLRWWAAVSILPLACLVAAPASAAGLTLPPPTAFDDLGGVPWATPSIVLLQAEDVVQGVSPTAFAPDAVLTAEQAVTLLARIFPGTLSSPPAGPPAGVDPWAVGAVEWAEGREIVAHPSAFDALAPTPRAQAVAWTVRALGLATNPNATPTFADAGAIPPQYAPEVAAAQADGLVSGEGNGDFDPASPLTRAQMAVLLVRAERFLALGQTSAPNPTLFDWTASQGTVSRALATGTVVSGSAALPAATLHATTVRTQNGSVVEDAVSSRGFGAGTLSTESGGVTSDWTFLWRSPTATQSGDVWVFTPAAPDGTQGFTYLTNGQPQLTTFQGTRPTGGLTGDGQVALGVASTNETITATICPGPDGCAGSTVSEVYDGPTIDATLLWMLVASGDPALVPSVSS